MKRILLTLTVGVALIGLVTSLFWIRSGTAKNVKFNIKDLPDHGLTIIGPASTSFDDEVRKLKKDKNERQQRKIDALRPFSGFIKNSGHSDVIAYTVKWELTTVDGQVMTNFSSYSATATVLGENVPDGDSFNGRKIKKNSVRISSWDPTIDDDGGPTAGFSGPVSPSLQDRFVQALRSGDDSALSEVIADQLRGAASITMTLDGALFADGTFVGPDTGGLFNKLNAEVSAKHDLLRSISLALKARKTPKQILDHIDEVNRHPRTGETKFASGGTREEYYRYFASIYRTEILKTRDSLKDDKRTLTYALLPTLKHWPKLKKQETGARL